MRILISMVSLLLAEAMLMSATCQGANFYDMSKRPYSTAGRGTAGDPWRGWERYLNGHPTTAGVIYFPSGTYQVRERVLLPSNCQITGDGMDQTFLQWPADYKGDGLAALAPINTSTRMGIAIRGLTIQGGGACGIRIQAGGHIQIFDCRTQGWTNGVALDQAEVVRISGHHFEMTKPNSRGLWLVNGPDLNPDAKPELTNCIYCHNSFFNGHWPNTIGIVDDGGYTHCFEQNTFTAGGRAGTFSGVKSLVISRAYFEEQQQNPLLTFSDCTLDGKAGRGACTTVSVCDCFANTGKLAFAQCLGGPFCLSLERNTILGTPDNEAKSFVIGPPPYRAADTATLTSQANVCAPGFRLFDDGPVTGENSRAETRIPK